MIRTRLLAILSPLIIAADNPAQPDQSPDELHGDFDLCTGSGRITCVVDGDTIWFEGEKIRLLDINTPETSRPSCDYEARLGAQATERLMTLLNEGPFSLQSEGRDRDRYGRLLRVVSRDGVSFGDILVAEGLAEVWQGRRSNWCTA